MKKKRRYDPKENGSGTDARGKCCNYTQWEMEGKEKER